MRRPAVQPLNGARCESGDGETRGRWRRPPALRPGRVNRIAALVLSSVLFSVGGLLMSASQSFTRTVPSIGVVACFAVGSALLAIAVGQGGLGSTYVMGLGIEATITITVGLLVLGERMSIQQGAGVVLIVIGLALVRG